MRFCDECGAELEEGVLFCDNCGAKQEPVSTDDVENNIENSISEMSAQVYDIPNEKLKKKNTKLIAIILSVVIVLGGGLGAYFLFFADNSASVYENAINLYAEKDYDGAIEALETIPDYEGSAEKINEILYDKAINLFEQKEYDNAVEILNTISDYNDSTEKINEISYAKATALYEEGKNSEAIEIYNELGDYKDSKDIISNIGNEEKYNEAITLESDGKTEEALVIFNELGDYKDSKSKAGSISISKSLGIYDEVAKGIWKIDNPSTNSLNFFELDNTISQSSFLKFGKDNSIEIMYNNTTYSGTYKITDDKITCSVKDVSENESEIVLSILNANENMYLENSFANSPEKIYWRLSSLDCVYINDNPEAIQEAVQIVANKATAKFDEFIANDMYDEYMQEYFSSYCILQSRIDVQQDGISELIIKIGNVSALFVYNQIEDKVQYVTTFFSNTSDPLKYSNKYKAIFVDEFEITLKRVIYRFYSMKNPLEVQKEFEVFDYYGFNKYSEINDSEEISESEYNSYIYEPVEMEFTEIMRLF